MNVCVSLCETERQRIHSEIRAMSNVIGQATQFKTACHSIDI